MSSLIGWTLYYASKTQNCSLKEKSVGQYEKKKEEEDLSPLVMPDCVE